MGRIRRKFTAEFKETIARSILSGETTQSAVVREHQIGPVLVKKWVDSYATGHHFVDKPSAREGHLEREVKKLQAKIGELVMENDLLKKLEIYVQKQRKLDSSVVTARNLEQLKKDAKS